MDIIARIAEDKIVPVFYHAQVETALQVVRTCYDAGLRSFEFTNRGENAAEVFSVIKAAAQQSMPDLVLGIGTIWSVEQANVFIDLGADFIVSPILDAETGIRCQQRNIPWMPGCMSPTEIFQAKKMGTPIVKVFPASVVGPAFIKSIKAVMPTMHLMATGGITTAPEDLKKWFDAGVTAVGIGKELLQQEVSITVQAARNL
jgi:2-dehydro-3-deoxyphosphogluconate aldolase/(4S)-4-hydroxy-2-oxoglutarate aldolase